MSFETSSSTKEYELQLVRRQIELKEREIHIKALELMLSNQNMITGENRLVVEGTLQIAMTQLYREEVPMELRTAALHVVNTKKDMRDGTMMMGLANVIMEEVKHRRSKQETTQDN